VLAWRLAAGCPAGAVCILYCGVNRILRIHGGEHGRSARLLALECQVTCSAGIPCVLCRAVLQGGGSGEAGDDLHCVLLSGGLLYP
jgi:hypothetical protein